ncbi:sporozoite invasion-associated protein 2 [Plasmodium gonderi]|uniref:Sporozoite invasion-associated protein 2 n=1 Tax=Plasmodium gonderi TaxID=77519 RepID=A0A1Y1JAS2_PLAGO|nr:sporozoite invasion-associated protein 2 [Plasmodium gonderi]GAW79609.1 sporozoite invasion-associated protein 2 [Plasmodium gonderi]
MKVQCKNYYYLLSVLFFINEFQLCLSHEMEQIPSEFPFLKLGDYTPSLQELFGSSIEEVLTSIHDYTTDEEEDDNHIKSNIDYNSNTDKVDSIHNTNPELDSFDELVDEIDNAKKIKKCLQLNIHKRRRRGSFDDLSDYENSDETTNIEEQENEEDEDMDEQFEIIYHPFYPNMEKFMSNNNEHHNNTTGDGTFSKEELELYDSEQGINLGKLEFFGLNKINSKRSNNYNSHRTQTETNSSNDKTNSKDSHENIKSEKRKQRKYKHMQKNPLENFSISPTYDDFLINQNLKDHEMTQLMLPGEHFLLDSSFHRVVKYTNVRLYILKLIYMNLKNIDPANKEYLIKNKFEVELFVKKVLRENYICFTHLQEERLLSDVHAFINKAINKIT